MGRNDEPVEVTVKIVQETPSAMLVTDDEIEPVWIAKSLIEDETDVNDEYIEITIPSWLAEREGFI